MTSRRLLVLLSVSLLVAFTSMLWRHLSPRSTIAKAMCKAVMSTAETKQSAIVVGSGLAGLSAASTLVSHGILVTLLERSAKPGGNSIKASSGINGAPTRFQPGPPFSDTSFYSDSIRSAGKVFEAASRGGKGERA
jgi:FAD-dependent fumarate reductase